MRLEIKKDCMLEIKLLKTKTVVTMKSPKAGQMPKKLENNWKSSWCFSVCEHLIA